MQYNSCKIEIYGDDLMYSHYPVDYYSHNLNQDILVGYPGNDVIENNKNKTYYVKAFHKYCNSTILI